MARPRPGPRWPPPVLGLETLERLFLKFGLDALAGIGDPEQDIVAIAPGSHENFAAGARKTDGIGEKVREDLADPLVVGDEIGDIVGDLDLQGEIALVDRIGDAAAAASQGLDYGKRAQLQLHGSGIDGGQVENGIDDRRADRSRTSWI